MTSKTFSTVFQIPTWLYISGENKQKPYIFYFKVMNSSFKRLQHSICLISPEIGLCNVKCNFHTYVLSTESSLRDFY